MTNVSASSSVTIRAFASTRVRLHWAVPAPVAQGIERAPPEREVAGSIPAGRILPAVRTYMKTLDPRLPRDVYVLQLGGLANAFGNGVVLPFLIIYLHNV